MSARIVPFDRYDSPQTIGLRLAPIDLGFDIRFLDLMTVRITAARAVVSYVDLSGRHHVVEGTAAEVADVLRAAGYSVEVTP